MKLLKVKIADKIENEETKKLVQQFEKEMSAVYDSLKKPHSTLKKIMLSSQYGTEIWVKLRSQMNLMQASVLDLTKVEK